jgi:FtsP/CotA-like multicopper oxidase with cupredoxin domain
MLIASNSLIASRSGETGVIQGPTYEGTIPGPTLIVHPGDTLKVDVVNQFPANPPVTRAGAFPHAPYTTNFHTHGLSVSPKGNSDNVLVEMQPGTSSPVQIELPPNHRAGSFWYHPHQHGAVTYQMMGGTAGMLIVKGGKGTIDAVPEVAAAKDIVMVFQVLHSLSDGQVAYVNPTALQFGSNVGLTDGLWSAYLGTAVGGGTPNSPVYFATNGQINPVLHMRPGEVQRWRMLNASSGESLLVALQGHALNVIQNDGNTIPTMLTMPVESPYPLGAGQRGDVLVQAGDPGTYLIQALDQSGSYSVTPQGIAPGVRQAHISGDMPTPNFTENETLATVVVEGKPMNMSLPTGPLPPPDGLPSIETMLAATPAHIRNIDFDLCGKRAGQQPPSHQLPSCNPYFQRYDASYWGGTDFTSLNMFRDADDVNYQKEALFNPNVPLFADMMAGTYEHWTVTNRSFSDHAFHIHQNPFLVTAVNGVAMPVPEWHDTILVPAATGGNNINLPCTSPGVPAGCVTYGSIDFITYYALNTVGSLVTHCHVIEHEDVGMMQRVDILAPTP